MHVQFNMNVTFLLFFFFFFSFLQRTSGYPQTRSCTTLTSDVATTSPSQSLTPACLQRQACVSIDLSFLSLSLSVSLFLFLYIYVFILFYRFRNLHCQSKGADNINRRRQLISSYAYMPLLHHNIMTPMAKYPTPLHLPERRHCTSCSNSDCPCILRGGKHLENKLFWMA